VERVEFCLGGCGYLVVVRLRVRIGDGTYSGHAMMLKSA
jgi:hypothetical protein